MISIPRIYRQRWDWTLTGGALALLTIGALTIYSATHLPDSPRHGYFLRIIRNR